MLDRHAYESLPTNVLQEGTALQQQKALSYKEAFFFKTMTLLLKGRFLETQRMILRCDNVRRVVLLKLKKGHGVSKMFSLLR